MDVKAMVVVAYLGLVVLVGLSGCAALGVSDTECSWSAECGNYHPEEEENDEKI